MSFSVRTPACDFSTRSAVAAAAPARLEPIRRTVAAVPAPAVAAVMAITARPSPIHVSHSDTSRSSVVRKFPNAPFGSVQYSWPFGKRSLLLSCSKSSYGGAVAVPPESELSFTLSGVDTSSRNQVVPSR